MSCRESSPGARRSERDVFSQVAEAAAETLHDEGRLVEPDARVERTEALALSRDRSNRPLRAGKRLAMVSLPDRATADTGRGRQRHGGLGEVALAKTGVPLSIERTLPPHAKRLPENRGAAFACLRSPKW